MEQTPHALRVIDDVVATLRDSRQFRAVEYAEPTIEGLLAQTVLPVAWVWDFQDAYDLNDMNTLLQVTTQVGLAVVFPVARQQSVRRVGRWWIATVQALLLADEGRSARAYLTEPIAAVIQPVADQSDRAAIFYQIAVSYYVNRTNPWADVHQ